MHLKLRLPFARLSAGLCALVLVLLLPIAGRGGGQATLATNPAAALTGLQVQGNQLLDGTGKPVRFIGVNEPGTSYMCVQGAGIFDGPSDQTSVTAIASWHVNAVRVLLNEDCWLGINGVKPAYSGATYQQAIMNYVNLLHQNAMYVELSLQWEAAGTTLAQSQEPILDEDHGPAFWTSVANIFKGDPATFFGLESEPHDIGWACWLSGHASCSVGYTAAGMQEAVNAVRATGATNVVSVSGINWADDLSQWLAYEPQDPQHQLIAEAHVYGNSPCGAQSNGACLNAMYGTVAQSVPVSWGETGETYDASDCGSAYMQVLLPWADAHNVSYMAWTWNPWGTCLSLIANWAGTPANAYGSWVQQHYAYLATIGNTMPTVGSLAPNNGPIAGGTSVQITGTNLTGATAVKFGSLAATTYAVNGATQITATSPSGSPGIADVTVTTPIGTSAINTGDQFAYTVPPPTVSAVTPTSGPAGGGTSVQITGTNLTGATAVKFGTLAATTYVVNSATQITATSPPGSGTVDVTVMIPGATSTTGAADNFTYVPNSLQLSPTGIGFGGLPVATASGVQALTVTNTGTTNVQVAAAMSSGNTDQFHVVDNACASVLLAPTATCTAHFTFNPTTAGDKLARFTVSGASSGILTLDLTGTGLVDACASTAISTDLTSPQTVGAHVNLMATSAGCPNAGPLYRFYVRDTSATWHIVQDFSTANSYLWDTTTWGQGTFLIGVWVKDANSANTYDAFAFGTFTLGLPTCSSTNMTSDVASPQAVGTTVNFTATSIGCPSPLYQWFVRDTAGNWSIVPGKDFAHSSTTFAWNTTGLADGTYQVGVWAKQTGSTNSYDAFAFITYTLTINHCTAVNLGTSVTSPQATGAAITLTPTVTGCANPQYRFYVRDAAGTWHIQQDFGVGATYLWNATSTPVNTTAAGTFLLGVWAKQAGSTNSYDAFAFITFSLTSGPTCTVNIAANQTSPQPLGTSATWTATASGCNATPLTYQFWVNPPGGTWGIVQPFSAANTYLWNGGTAGTYQVGVWVKQSGSTASYDNFAFTTFTLTPAAAHVCSSVNVGAAPGSPQSVGTAVTFTATGVVGCASPQYRWWVRDTSATWNMVQDYPGNSTFNWSTGSQPAGTYLVGVWVRQTGSSASYEAYYFLTFTLTGGASQACSSVNIAPSVPSPQAPGANITFTATALGCGTPTYRFFIAPPSTGVFTEVQPFGTANTYLWHTAGLPPGPYQVGVWARQSGSTATYEAFAFITFQLQISPCIVTTLTTSPSQSNPSGTAMTFTASASGCPNPQYQFVVYGPGGTLIIDQPYSSSATLNWSTASLPAGQYLVLVVARDATSVASFDSYAWTWTDVTLT